MGPSDALTVLQKHSRQSGLLLSGDVTASAAACLARQHSHPSPRLLPSEYVPLQQLFTSVRLHTFCLWPFESGIKAMKMLAKIIIHQLPSWVHLLPRPAFSQTLHLNGSILYMIGVLAVQCASGCCVHFRNLQISVCMCYGENAVHEGTRKCLCMDVHKYTHTLLQAMSTAILPNWDQWSQYFTSYWLQQADWYGQHPYSGLIS